MKNNVLAHIKSVAPKVSESIDVCLSSNKVNKVNAALTEAKKQTADALASVLEHPHRRSLSSTRKSLTAIDNLLGGLMHGLETRELKVKDFRAVCSNLQTTFIPKLENSISEEVEKFQAVAGDETQQEVELTPEQQEIRKAILAAEAIAQEDESDYDRDDKARQREEEQRRNQLSGITGDVERRLARLRSLVTNLPTRLKMPYAVVKVPVAPHFESEAAKNPVLLDKLAIPHSEIPLPGLGRDGAHGVVRMERYVIYEQQNVLCISKSYVESLLKHKTEELDDDNSAQGKEWRARRKDLKEQLADAEKKLAAKVEEFSATPSNKAGVDRLRSEMNKLEREMKKQGQTKFTPADKKIYDQFVKAGEEVSSTAQQIDELSEQQKANAVEIEVYSVKMKKLRTANREAQELRSTLEETLDKLYEKYAKSKDLRDLNKQLRIARKKFYRAENAEFARLRLIPDAEERIAFLNKSAEKFEEEVKSKRRVAKRAGPAITPEDYAKSVLSVINERSENQMDFVSMKAAPNPRNSRDILCYWIMPTQKLSALMRHTGGKAKVTQWDFPFESERFEKAPDQRTGWEHPSQRGGHLLVVNGRPFKDLSEDEQIAYMKDLSLADRREMLEFLEFAKNASHRPKKWKSQYHQPVRKPE